MKKLIIVSNRLPTTVRKEKGKLSFEPSVGGVATGLSSLDTDYEKCWIGWPGIDYGSLSGEQVSEMERRLAEENFYPVGLSAEEVKDYYQGFCNEVIWPIFHYFVQYGTYKKEFWESYISVNTKFAAAILDVASEGDYIWVHDYHLMLVPELVKKQLPRSSIGFFLHIPFPSSEIFRLIPWCREIIQGLTGADLIGFHTFDYVRHFAESVRRILGHEHSLGRFIIGEREIRTDTFPMGIDYEKFSSAPKKRSIQKRKDEFRNLLGNDRKVILSIDRLDYSKGIPERLRAFDFFLEKNPELREKVVLLLVAVPSRTEVVHYKILKNEVDNLVGAINGRYDTIGWNPIHYMYRSFGFEDLISLYLAADILFITPLRDGMNLIAKEYVAARQNKDGVLILGEMAGTAQELSEAIIINPNDLESTSRALETALSMTKTEQKRRMKAMQSRLSRYDIRTWTADFMERLDETKERQLKMFARRFSPEMTGELIEKYKASKKCLFLLDYDGSLVSFKNNPQDAEPDPELYSALEVLSSRGKNELVIISGRDRNTLTKWLGDVTNGLAAEHGLWIRRGKWKMLDVVSEGWKEEIRPILEVFVDRTPGSLIEEKNFSLAWHYRKVDPALSIVRVGELKDMLSHITANLEVGVLEGNKVVEIKGSFINKGKAATQWLKAKKWDLIISIGDDWTDEDIFEQLPEDAYSIKVGFGPSKAKYRVRSTTEARDLLFSLVEATREIGDLPSERIKNGRRK